MEEHQGSPMQWPRGCQVTENTKGPFARIGQGWTCREVLRLLAIAACA